MSLNEDKLKNVEAEINYCLAHISNLQARLAQLEAERLRLREIHNMELLNENLR